MSSLCQTGMFTIQPSTVVLPVGAHAQFQCQHLDAITLTWSIGGVYLYQYHPPNVTTTVFLQVSTLTIPGLVRHNGTAIQCKAIFNLATDDHELSNVAYLLLQGKKVTLINKHAGCFKSLQAKLIINDELVAKTAH